MGQSSSSPLDLPDSLKGRGHLCHNKSVNIKTKRNLSKFAALNSQPSMQDAPNPRAPREPLISTSSGQLEWLSVVPELATVTNQFSSSQLFGGISLPWVKTLLSDWSRFLLSLPRKDQRPFWRRNQDLPGWQFRRRHFTPPYSPTGPSGPFAPQPAAPLPGTQGTSPALGTHSHGSNTPDFEQAQSAALSLQPVGSPGSILHMPPVVFITGKHKTSPFLKTPETSLTFSVLFYFPTSSLGMTVKNSSSSSSQLKRRKESSWRRKNWFQAPQKNPPIFLLLLKSGSLDR